MVTMGNCDCCGAIQPLHLCGEYVICDACEILLSPDPPGPPGPGGSPDPPGDEEE